MAFAKRTEYHRVRSPCWINKTQTHSLHNCLDTQKKTYAHRRRCTSCIRCDEFKRQRQPPHLPHESLPRRVNDGGGAIDTCVTTPWATMGTLLGSSIFHLEINYKINTFIINQNGLPLVPLRWCAAWIFTTKKINNNNNNNVPMRKSAKGTCSMCLQLSLCQRRIVIDVSASLSFPRGTGIHVRLQMV